ARNRLLPLLLLAPVIAGCSGATDLLTRDAEWFSRPGRLFIRNISIDAPPLTPHRPVTSEDLVSADGFCPGMAPPGSPAAGNYTQGQRAGIYTFTAGRLPSVERGPEQAPQPKPAKSKPKKKPAAT